MQQSWQVEQAIFHQGHRQWQQQFDAADAWLGSPERCQLGIALVRLVMAGDRLDHPGLHRLAQAIAVGAGAQRRLYVVQAGEVAQRFVGENQLVQRHVGGDRQAQLLGLGNQARTTGTGQLAEVRAHAGLFDQQQVARQGHGFGGFRDARQAEEAGHGAFVGQAALGQVAVLGVEHHGQVEGGGVFQGAGQGTVVGDFLQAIAEGHAAGVAQGHQLGQLLAFQALGQGADRVDLAVGGLAGAVEDQFGHGRGVQHRLGLRRAAQAGDTAGDGGAGFTGDVAFAAVARLAQGHAEVDQAGRGDQAISLDRAAGVEAGRGGTDGGNAAAVQVQVGDLVQAAVGVDDPGAENTDGHWAFSWSN
ncbi:hypothetical protein D3C78_590700 [compost metagenome]